MRLQYDLGNGQRMRIIFVFVIVAAAASLGCWSFGGAAGNRAVAAGPTPMKQDQTPKGDFVKHLPAGFEMPEDDSGKLLLREYGSVFITSATPPKKVVFKNQADVLGFQATLDKATQTIGGTKVELQRPAMDALNDAIAEARKVNLTIGPRGADSSRRDYDATVGLWASRVDPGFAHWVAAGKVSAAEAKRIKALTPYEQVPEILKLEQQQIWFAKTLDKSIIYSVAPPGTSQHLSMLALDVKEFENANVRAILARHGWFQTVSSDLPHFTYLGVSEAELPGLGLKKVENAGRVFWVPDM
ncbi:MAG: hypothetical protein JO053_05850 [Acidobacteria bacterium]|nr:hypothetical protein [Acidobacteriota bacterium]